MKITIIGGSAFGTPCLIKFLDREKGPGRMEIVLASRSRRKLDAVTSASKLLVSGEIAIRAQEIGNNTWEQVLDGSDCVLIRSGSVVTMAGYLTRRSRISMAYAAMKDLAWADCQQAGEPGQ